MHPVPLNARAGALGAYRKAIALHRQAAAAQHANGTADGGGEGKQQREGKAERMSAKLLNNAAVLTMRSGDARCAIELMQEALQARRVAALDFADKA